MIKHNFCTRLSGSSLYYLDKFGVLIGKYQTSIFVCGIELTCILQALVLTKGAFNGTYILALIASNIVYWLSALLGIGLGKLLIHYKNNIKHIFVSMKHGCRTYCINTHDAYEQKRFN